MKYQFAIIFMMLVFFQACKKGGPDPVTGNPNVDTPVVTHPVDTLIGAYIGRVRETKETFISQPPPGQPDTVYYDTTYYLDTIFIDKVSADSFKVANPDMAVNIKPVVFLYSVGGKYNDGYGISGTSSKLSLDFKGDGDSLYLIHDRFSGPYGNYTKTYREFAGRKQ